MTVNSPKQPWTHDFKRNSYVETILVKRDWNVTKSPLIVVDRANSAQQEMNFQAKKH